MLDLDTTVVEYVAFIKARHPCIEGIEKLEAFANEVTYIKDITTYLNEEKSEWFAQWTLWTLIDHGDQMAPALRQSFFGRISDCPPQAFSAYRSCDWLSDEEDKMLESIFEGKIPLTEQNLQDGFIIRKKVG